MFFQVIKTRKWFVFSSLSSLLSVLS